MPSKSILLVIGGGIAAYKSLELVRRLRERGIGARAILTKAGAEFVTPLSVSALTGEKVFQDMFSLTDQAEMGTSSFRAVPILLSSLLPPRT